MFAPSFRSTKPVGGTRRVTRSRSIPNLLRGLFGLALISFFAIACAGTSATPLPAEYIEPTAIFYVKNHAKDQRGLAEMIARALREKNLNATFGFKDEPADEASFLVTYVDRWAWDMRTYLSDLTIKIHETETGGLIAESRSYQDSLSVLGKTYEEIVRQTTLRLLEPSP